jgi:hypothetical protein
MECSLYFMLTSQHCSEGIHCYLLQALPTPEKFRGRRVQHILVSLNDVTNP